MGGSERIHSTEDEASNDPNRTMALAGAWVWSDVNGDGRVMVRDARTHRINECDLHLPDRLNILSP